MKGSNHVPSLTHLRDFARARSKGRPTHVERDRQQVEAPTGDRFFGFAYEKFITAVIDYVNSGYRNDALRRAVDQATERMKPSYGAAAAGMAEVFATFKPAQAARRQRSVMVRDPRDGMELVSLRIHLVFDMGGRQPRHYAFLHFPPAPLTEVEMEIMDTAVALAVAEIDPNGVPLVIDVRRGAVRQASLPRTRRRMCIDRLRDESAAYRVEWANAA